MKSLILLTTITLIFCGSLIAQISENREQVTLAVFLNRVSTAFDVTFSYSKDFLPLNRRVNVKSNYPDLKTALDQAFEDQPISYKWIGESVVLKVKAISPKKPPLAPKAITSISKTKPLKKAEPVDLIQLTALLDYQWTAVTPAYAKPGYKKRPPTKVARPVFDRKTNSITAFNPLDYRMPRMIVLQAFERIEDNFFVKPRTFKGYFREIFMQDEQAVSLVDAIVKIDDRGYKQIKNDQTGLESVSLLAVRSSDNEIRAEFKPDFDRFNSLRALLNWNDIKYRDKDEELNIGKSTYVLDSSILVNGGLIYVFTSTKRSTKKIHQTTYHIDAETSAILKVVYREKAKPNQYLDQQWELTGDENYVFKAKETQLTYTFGKYMKKMYLKEIQEISYADVFHSWEDNVAWEFGCHRQMVIRPAVISNKAVNKTMNDQQSLALQTTVYDEEDWTDMREIKKFNADQPNLANLQLSTSLEQQFTNNAERIR